MSKGLTILVAEDVKIYRKKPVEDFVLLEFRRGTNIVIGAYLGNQPSFPLEKGHSIKKETINGIAVESIEYKGKDGLHSREVLFHLSDSSGWPQLLHCWYSNLNNSEAQEAESMISTIRLTHPAARPDSKPAAK